MKIALVWYFDKAGSIFDNWRDGVRGAMDYMESKGHKVSYYLDKTTPDPEEEYDAILLWDDSNSDFIQILKNIKQIRQTKGLPPVKSGLLLTTDPHNIDALREFDVIFCESTPVYDQVRRAGLHAVKAFGTDTDFFKPNASVGKDLEFFYPATFSPWKQQAHIAHLGPKLTCIGTIQPDGVGHYQACVDNAVNVEVGYFPVEHIRNYYWRARGVIIPAIHGSERTVLEAMACNILPVVTDNMNKKTQSYVNEYNAWEEKDKTPRKFVLKHYSHKIYANKIIKGLS